VLSVLTTVADNALHQVKAENERKWLRAMFIKDLQLRVALREYSDAERRDPKKKMQERDKIPMQHTYSRYDDAESPVQALLECCDAASYRSILHGLPQGMSDIIRDLPKDRDRNLMIIDVVQAAISHRLELNSEKGMIELKTKAKPLRDRLNALRNDSLRCAAILEMINLLVGLVDLSNRDGWDE
jgi:hypothetical protein